MSKEAMKLALEALMRSRKAVSGDLDLAGCAYGSNDPDGHRYDDAKKALVTLDKAITALREALVEQPAKQDIPDLIAGTLGVSRGTAYDLMREALKDAAPVQELLLYINPKVIDPATGKVRNGAGALTFSDSPCAGWSLPLYTTPPAAPVQEPPTVAELLCVCGAEWEWRNRDWELVATPPAQRKPLTDEQIEKCFAESDGTFVSAGRAIEAAHGIKENT